MRNPTDYGSLVPKPGETPGLRELQPLSFLDFTGAWRSEVHHRYHEVPEFR